MDVPLPPGLLGTVELPVPPARIRVEVLQAVFQEAVLPALFTPVAQIFSTYVPFFAVLGIAPFNSPFDVLNLRPEGSAPVSLNV